MCIWYFTNAKKRLRKKAERLSSSRHLTLNRPPSSFVTLLAVLFAVTFAFVSIITLSPFKEHSTSTTNSPKASSNLELTPFIFLDPATSLIPLCMDIHPNPGPSQSFYELPSIIRNTYNDLKRIQQKLARHENHLENYSFFIRKRLVPHGLLPKTRPAFDSHNPQFHQSWKQNQQYFGRQQLKLPSQECKIKIEDLRRDEMKLKNKLRSICNDSATYDSLTNKLSNHISNQYPQAKRQTCTQTSNSNHGMKSSHYHAIQTSTSHASA